jgi:hypothetical protein
VGGWNEIEIIANSVQLKLELGLSLAKMEKKMKNIKNGPWGKPEEKKTHEHPPVMSKG